MDCEFAQSIADALEKCAKEARREAFLEAARLVKNGSRVRQSQVDELLARAAE